MKSKMSNIKSLNLFVKEHTNSLLMTNEAFRNDSVSASLMVSEAQHDGYLSWTVLSY